MNNNVLIPNGFCWVDFADVVCWNPTSGHGVIEPTAMSVLIVQEPCVAEVKDHGTVFVALADQ